MPSANFFNAEPKSSITSKLKRIVVTVLSVSLLAIIWFFIQIRHDYYGKVSVTEAIKFSEHVASAVDAHFLQHKIFPLSLSEITLPRGEMGYVPIVTIDSASGVLTIVVASTEGKFGTLEYIPTSAANQRLQWSCRNVSVSKKYLPAKCIS